MHITITGNLGSGKSTICKILEDKYGFEIYSTGKVQRELARQMNITTLEMNQLMCSDHKYDNMIDDTTARISRENPDKNIIFDSRLAWHFVEKSFKVFLSVGLDIAAERVMKDNRGKEEQYSSIEEAKEKLFQRAQTENMRYKDIYNLEYFNFSNYNLVIESAYSSPELIASIIMKEAKDYYALIADNHGQMVDRTRILLSPKSLYKEEVTKEERNALKGRISEYEKIKELPNVQIAAWKDGDSYQVLSALEEVKAAKEAGVPFLLTALNIQ
ncbi:cytidylate kinase family protein [Anaerocolumna xylanovorans]|uniref:Cytidylate kinase, putative n=1 Tax=Anaerocolumna xylanovorans DSM 12503 TaxID=1121345 RepID=A0A1M7YKD7_9FIRM|nr:cytidylate kinase family protein [Anaerocolumna xylanovorans]SHO53008.1 cytidylate kinase, putative [Anaerocolumna xylanovorans DSM 12503]